MDSYIAVVFKSDSAAFAGLHDLWRLDTEGAITTHTTAVVRRDAAGRIELATKSTHPGMRTAFGIGIGALLGALAGPVGAVAGVTAAVGAGVGAATGGAIGIASDARKAAEHEEVFYDTGFVLDAGESAVLAEVSEDWATPVDDAMKRLGGRVYRRGKSDVQNDALFGDYGRYMYPYDYEPSFA